MATTTKEVNTFAKDYANFMVEIQGSSIARSEAYNYDYLTLDAIVKTATPIAVKNNLIFYWSTETNESGDPAVWCFLRHTNSEESIHTTVPVHYPRTGKVMQAAGAALTYARRYGLQQVLCISPDKDDDAKDVVIQKKANIVIGDGASISEDQKKKIWAMAYNSPEDKKQERIKYLGLNIDSLGADTFNELVKRWS